MISFLDKIKYLSNSYQELDGMVRCHLIMQNHGVCEDFLKQLIAMFPSLPKTYLEYLKHYDGLKIDWITLYGSPDSEGFSLLEVLDLWTRTSGVNFLKDVYCPIGEDAGGNLFCLNSNNQVVMFDSEIYEEQEPTFIASSFEEFINECVLGKRYLELMEKDDFYYFLKSQGWA